MSDKRQVIVCAANQEPSGNLILGVRHCDMIMHSHRTDLRHTEQGFIDNFGNFLTREQAWVVAEAAGQIKYRVGGDTKRLFSENLY